MFLSQIKERKAHVKVFVVAFLVLLLLGCSSSSPHVDGNATPYFSFPTQMREGITYRVSNHTNFAWDKLTIYSIPFLVDEFLEVYKEIMTFNPSIVIFDELSQVLVFYENSEIVYVKVYGYSRIINSQREHSEWKLEFSIDDAVFTSVKNDLWGYKLVPYTE